MTGGRARGGTPTAVEPEENVGVEHSKQGVEVTRPRRGEKGGDDLALLCNVGIRLRRGATHAAAGATRELTRGCRRAVDDRGDLLERHAEHVVQHE